MDNGDLVFQLIESLNCKALIVNDDLLCYQTFLIVER